MQDQLGHERVKSSCTCSILQPHPAGHHIQEVTGFHSKRHDFEPEYDNDAEVIVADLEFREDEAPEETEAKLRLVAIYNERLTERERRRGFIIERGLLHVKRQQVGQEEARTASSALHLQGYLVSTDRRRGCGRLSSGSSTK